jgi:hypothetical protein
VARKTEAREFMEWLLARIDDSGEDVTVEFPADDPAAECLDVWRGGKFYSVYVSHTHDPRP